VKLLEALASKLPCCLALDAWHGIKPRECRQGLVNNISQLISG
jgi:hypothetical protein